MLLAGTVSTKSWATSLSTPAKLTSQSAACNILEQTAARDHFASTSAGPGWYWCDNSAPQSGYYVIGLHYASHEPAGWVGSNLVGWYAVRQTDGQIFTWDMADNEPGSPASGK
jgi:hypothetical protein